MSKNLGKVLGLGLMTAVLSAPALAAPITWTDWTSNTSTTATGTLTIGADVVTINLSSTSPLSFVITGAGTNYWTGPAYTGGTADNAPPASDIVALNEGGTITVSFSQAIKNAYVGLVSWNGNTVKFNTPITIDSFGPGFWGSGTPVPNGTGDGFFGSGEVHGVLQLPGNLNGFSFTHTSEGWHGLTIGVADLADDPTPTPEPGMLGLLSLGLGLIARRRARA